MTNRKSPLVTRKCWKDYCHASHVNIQIISYWCIIIIVLMLNRTDSNKDLQEIGAANYAVLERIRVNRREDHLKVSQCNKHAFNWQSVRKWIGKFCVISSQAQKWADFVLQINFIVWFLHQFFQPRILLKTYWIYNNIEEALPNGSKHLVNSRKFALKFVLSRFISCIAVRDSVFVLPDLDSFPGSDRSLQTS